MQSKLTFSLAIFFCCAVDIMHIFSSRSEKEPLKKVKKEEKREKDRGKGKLDETALVKDVYVLPSPAPMTDDRLPTPITPPMPKKDLKLPTENVKHIVLNIFVLDHFI